MPTGYTAPVLDGEMYQAREFVKNCARAFGAFIHQRDDSSGPAVEPSVDDLYSMKALAEARAELDVLLTWTPERIKSEHARYVDRTKRGNSKAVRKYNEEKARLEFMLKQLKDWTPNEQAQPVKDFAITQIEETIDFDCGHGPYTQDIEEDSEAWYNDKLAFATDQVTYYEARFKEDMERAMDRKAYARAVLDSIDQIPRVSSYDYAKALGEEA